MWLSLVSSLELIDSDMRHCGQNLALTTFWLLSDLFMASDS